MKSTSRKFIRCKFCDDSSEMTKEHIFGSALNKRFKSQPIAAVKRTAAALDIPWSYQKSSHKPTYRSSGSTPFAFTSTSVCGDCNERMGKELSRFTNVIESLIRGRTNTIEQRYTALALRYFQRIGILVDLETAAFDPSEMTESLDDIKAGEAFRVGGTYLTKSDRKRFLDGEISSKISVFLGRCDCSEGRGFGMNVARYFDGLDPTPTAKRLVGRKFVFSAKKLTCLIVVGRNSRNVNFNEKLQLLEDVSLPFKLDHLSVSNSRDIKKNFSKTTTYPDKTVSVSNM